MEANRRFWKPFLVLLAMLISVSLACGPLGSEAPTAVPTADVQPTTVEDATAEPTADSEPTKKPTSKPTQEATPVPPEANVALKTFRVESSLFTVKYPSEWEVNEQTTEVEFNPQENGEGFLEGVTWFPSDAESGSDFDGAVELYKGILEAEADFEQIDEVEEDNLYRLEFRATEPASGTPVHAYFQIQAVGNYIFILAFATPDTDWETWQPTAATIIKSFKVDEELASQTIEPTSVPTGRGDLVIVNQTQYKDTYDSWRISGEVRNDGAETVRYVELSVELFDASNKSLALETIYVSRNYIPPGEVSPFMYYVSSDYESDFDHFELAVADSSSADETLVPLDVSNTSMIVDSNDDSVYVIGELTNNSDVAVDISTVSASVFAGDEFRVGDSAWSRQHYLEPGATGPFLIQFTGPIEGADDFKIHVDAIEATFTEPANVSISNEIFYADEYDDWHLVGNVTNDSDKALSISLIASIYDADGKLIDVATGNSFLSAVEPGEIDSFDVSYYRAIEASGADTGSLSYSIAVDSYLTYETDTVMVTGLVESNEDQEIDGDTVVFTGELENTNDFDVEDVIVVITLIRSSDEAVVGASYTWIFDPIPAGEKVEYSVTMYMLPGLDIDDVEYTLVARGRKVEQ